MQLQDLTWFEVENYLQHKDGIIIPIGSTEQHGPSGVIGTDAMVAEAVAREIGVSADVLVGPVQSLGVAEHHMAFAGTLSLRPSTLMAVLHDYIFSLLNHGFRSFFFINGHGGNVATLKAAFSDFQTAQRNNKSYPSFRCTASNWYDVEEVSVLRKKYFAEKEGRHATPSEIAVVQYLRNELIHDAPLPPPAPPQGDIYGAQDFRQKYPDGRIGAYSELATPELGQSLFEAAVLGGEKEIKLFFSMD